MTNNYFHPCGALQKHQIFSLVFAGVVAFVSLSVFVFTVFSQTARTDVVLLSNLDQGGRSIFSSTTRRTQTFLTPATGSFTLSKIKVTVMPKHFSRVTLDTITVSLFAATAKTGDYVPDSETALATQTIPAGTGAGEYTMTFDSAVTLSADTRYGVLFVVADATDRVEWTDDLGEIDDDSPSDLAFSSLWYQGTDSWVRDESYNINMALIGTPPVGISMRNPSSDPEQSKTVRAFVNITGTDNAEGYVKYALVSSDSDCVNSNSGDAAFADYVSGSAVTLSSQSDNGKKACFLASDGVAITDADTGLVAHSINHPVTVGIHEGVISAVDLVGNSQTRSISIVVLPRGLPLETTAVSTQDGVIAILNSAGVTHTVFFDTENDVYFHLPQSMTPTYAYNDDSEYSRVKDTQEVVIMTAAIDPVTTLMACFDSNGMPSRTRSITVFVDGVKVEDLVITEEGGYHCFAHDTFAGGAVTIAVGERTSSGDTQMSGGFGFLDFFFSRETEQTVSLSQQQQVASFEEEVVVRTILVGERSPYVLEAQQILNEKTDCQVAIEGAGSRGQETDYLGDRTVQALVCFQRSVGFIVTGTLTPETYEALLSLTRPAQQEPPSINLPLYLQEMDDEDAMPMPQLFGL